MDLGKGLLPESKAWEIVARAPSILPQGTELYSGVPASGITQLDLRAYPIGSFAHETSSTSFSFTRSDRLVYATASIRPLGPCQPTSAMAGPTFSYLRNPDPRISGGFYDFHGRLQSGLGHPLGGFQDFGYLDPYRPQAPHQLSGVQGGYSGPTALGPSASGPQVMIATDNSTVVSYINKQGGTQSPTLLRLTVGLFLWLESQSIIVRARHIPGCLNVIADHLSRPNQPIPTEWSLHPVCDIVELPPSLVHISSSGAKSPSGGCSVSGLAGEVNAHVSPVPPAQQSLTETAVHSGGRSDSGSPLVAVSVVVSTSTTSLCGTPSSSPLPSGSSVLAGPEVHLRRKVVPSTRMEALMRHYKAAGFSDEVSRLAAAPRRPSTNRMYDDRWRRFDRWAAGQGKSPYEPLREASFKHLTLKTVFLPAMASAGRRSELHALRFDQSYIQFKPKGAGVTLYFSPEFMRKNQKPNQVNDPWFIPAIPTGKPEFRAPNCPVRALRYYHRYLTEHPELRKDRLRLFVPIKDNNPGKELSASSISRWICTTIVDSHAAIQDSKNLSGSVKVHEVRAVATSLQLFNKVDLHAVMKAGRWTSGGTFTSFYLRDLCPQADSLQRAGPIVAAGDIVRISTS